MAVDNPRMFIGEIVLGATLGAPLSVSTTGKVASGIINTSAIATADTTTTSTTDVLINAMTLTPPTAGNYLIWFSTTVDHSNQNVAVVMSLYVGGAQITDTPRGPIPRTNAVGAITQSPCVSINSVVTVNGSQAIEIRWKTSAGTATAHQRTLNVLRVS